MVFRASRSRSKLLPWVLPFACACCHEPVSRDTGALCRRCARDRLEAPPLPTPEGLSSCLAVYAYEGVVKHEVLSMKATGRFGAVPTMAHAMFEVVRPRLHPDTLITWAPTSKRRIQRRGFDQAEELARALAKIAGLVSARVLDRVSLTAQHGATRSGRADVSFRARPLFLPGSWPDVVVVDDVRTTGATLGAAARSIRDKGGQKIIGIAYAATPERR